MLEPRTIGQSGITASPIALGTWAAGGGPWWGAGDDAESIKAIQAALDHGMNLIDTAPVYGFGHSEELLGRALQGRREQAVIATKCGLWWHDHSGFPFFEQAGNTVRRCLLPKTIRLEVEDSLRRLKTDVIDLYQTHWQEEGPQTTPIADTMTCLLKLKQEGKIRAIGVSNVTSTQLRQYQQVGPVDACQPRYSMLDRSIEAELLPLCRQTNVAILAYSPLEQGLLCGKIGMDATFKPEEYRSMLSWFKPSNRQRVLDLLVGWRDLEVKYNCSLAQLVIAWTVAQPGITFALCGGRKVRHIVENAGARQLALDPVDLQRMRQDLEALGEPVG